MIKVTHSLFMFLFTTVVVFAQDTDADGLLDVDETTIYGTDPFDDDTDNDGLTDGNEVNNYSTDPLLFDTDGDNLSDGLELGIGAPEGSDTDISVFVADGDFGATTTNPNDEDTDGGGVFDDDEDLNINGVFDAGETDPNNSADDVPLSTTNATFIESINVFPNPVISTVTLTFKEVYNTLEIKIINSIGKVLSTSILKHQTEHTLNITGPSGIYFISLKNNNNESLILKLIKQ